MKKIYFLGNDVNLLNALNQTEQLSVGIIESLGSLEADAFIISDRNLSYNELSGIKMNDNTDYFYLLSNMNDQELELQIQTICHSKGIHMIQPRQSVDAITKEIKRVMLNIVPMKENKVIGLFSSISNVGLTTSAVSLAYSINEMTNAKIGVIGLNVFEDGSDQFEYQGRYLNEIKSELAHQFLTAQTLETYFHKQEKIYYLAGNQNTRIERLFTTEEISYLIKLAKQIFDLVILDGGSHFDNAASIQVLNESDIKLLVLNQQQKSIKKFKQIQANIFSPLRIEPKNFLLVVNPYIKDESLLTVHEIANETNVPMLTYIPHDHYGLLAEQNRRPLYTYQNPEYKEAIENIARGIISRTNLSIINQVETTKKKFFAWRKRA